MIADSILEWKGEPPQFACEDGALWIWTCHDAMRLRWRPRPWAEQQSGEEAWTACCPEFRLIVPEADEANPLRKEPKGKAEALAAFRQEIPKDLRRIVEPFRSHQWLLLALAHEIPAIRELAENNPVLAYALANSHEFRHTPAGIAGIQALRHSYSKQKWLCAWLGFPGTNAMVNVFRRIQPEAVFPSRLRLLRLMLEEHGERLIDLLAQRRQITAPVLDCILVPQLMPLVTPKLLDEIEGAPDVAAISAAVDRLTQSLRLLQDMKPARPVRPFESLRQIETFAEEVEAESVAYHARGQAEKLWTMAERARRMDPVLARRAKQYKARLRAWPAPPLPGNEDIVPITSYAMLCEESDLQHNCIREYCEPILQRQRLIYAYQLMRPVRATFTIIRYPSMPWQLSEIRGKKNHKVSAEARRAVLVWLARGNR